MPRITKKEVIDLKAVLVIWGVKDDILKKLPIEGHWLYGEYDFISILDFDNSGELEEFKEELYNEIKELGKQRNERGDKDGGKMLEKEL